MLKLSYLCIDEERFLDGALVEMGKKKSKFQHFEDRFDDFNQTVVIWCLKDFFQNKKYALFSFHVSKTTLIRKSFRFSEDTFSQLERKKRLNRKEVKICNIDFLY